MPLLQQTVSRFGEVVAERFATGGGEPEDLLRGPFEELTKALATASGSPGVVLAGEHHLADDRVRPDYAVFVDGALTGFVEIKAPGWPTPYTEQRIKRLLAVEARELLSGPGERRGGATPVPGREQRPRPPKRALEDLESVI